MKKVAIPAVAIITLLTFFACQKSIEPDSTTPGIITNPPIRKALNGDYPDFCTNSCSYSVGYIGDGIGTSGTDSWGNFHLWISQPLPYDVVITIQTTAQQGSNPSYSILPSYGTQFTIPAGQNNTSTISSEQDAYNLGIYHSNDKCSGSASSTFTVQIVSIDRADNLANLNNQFQLYPGKGSFKVSTSWIGTENNGLGCPENGGGGL